MWSLKHNAILGLALVLENSNTNCRYLYRKEVSRISHVHPKTSVLFDCMERPILDWFMDRNREYVIVAVLCSIILWGKFAMKRIQGFSTVGYLMLIYLRDVRITVEFIRRIIRNRNRVGWNAQYQRIFFKDFIYRELMNFYCKRMFLLESCCENFILYSETWMDGCYSIRKNRSNGVNGKWGELRWIIAISSR